MQQQAWKPETSLGELFGDLTRETKHLVRQEVELAKVELKESAVRMGKGAAFIGAGAVLGIGAMLSLLAAVIALLGTFMPVWLAAMIVSLAIGGAGYLLVNRGIKALKTVELTPRETIETVREDVVWLKKRN
ncbi:MAG: phage holin family protein [Gemmatimonadota bacterium]